MQNTIVRWLICILLSMVLAPVMVFLSGFLMVGDYAGDNGFLGFTKTIYGAALTGKLSAWMVLLAPLLVLLTWVAVKWLWNAVPRSDSTTATT